VEQCGLLRKKCNTSIPADTLVMLVEVTARETLQREVDYVYTAVGKIKYATVAFAFRF